MNVVYRRENISSYRTLRCGHRRRFVKTIMITIRLDLHIPAQSPVGGGNDIIKLKYIDGILSIQIEFQFRTSSYPF